MPFLKKYTKNVSCISDKNMSLVYHCDANVTVHIDQQRFEQVMMNLLDNALKYSHQGSTVSIDVKTEKKNVILIISDEGIGIPEKICHIFLNGFTEWINQDREQAGVQG